MQPTASCRSAGTSSSYSRVPADRVGLSWAMATVHGIVLQKGIVQRARIIAPTTLGIAKRSCGNGSRSLGFCSTQQTCCRSIISSTRSSSSGRGSAQDGPGGGEVDRRAVDARSRRPVEDALVVGGGIAGEQAGRGRSVAHEIAEKLTGRQ